MWTSWLERTLGAHDAADYAELRAKRPELGEADAPGAASPSAASPSPPVGPTTIAREGRAEGAWVVMPRRQTDSPLHRPAARRRLDAITICGGET
jgi:hypothetical protein